MTEISPLQRGLLSFHDLFAASTTAASKPKQEAPPAGPPLSATVVAQANADAAATKMQTNLDGFRASAAGPYAIDVGGAKTSVAAPAQFRMVSGYNYECDKKVPDGTRIARALGPKRFAALEHEIGRVLAGRGSPSDVRKVTQALIDAGQLGPTSAEDAPAAIQAMQWKFGVGVDCAGYVQRAFFAARGMQGTPAERARYGFSARVVDEGFGGLAANGKFRKVDPVLAKPGDLINLAPPEGEKVGHTVIVASNTKMNADGAALKLPAARFPGPFQKIEVDSSWGAGEQGKGGGVKREVWLYDPQTKAWATYDPKTKTATPSKTDGPYDHPLNGVFRPKGEP